MNASNFHGFPEDLVTFYQKLSQNNEKIWFEAHKDVYLNQVLAPAREFVSAMGQRLASLSPNILIDTRTNGAGSIFRIYRDTRFSKDKRPYKTYLGIFLWEGSQKKMENSGYYFHLESGTLMLGAGMHTFPKPVIETFRDSVVDPVLGADLQRAVNQITDLGYQIGGLHYKRVPRGYDPTLDTGGFLLHNGMYAFTKVPIPKELFTPEIVDYCFERFRDMYPVHRWVLNLLSRAHTG